LLPCGWLYLFALLAAGTGHALTGMLVMIAFWIGTVPALIALVSGLRFMGGRVRQMIPTGAALMLIVAGFTTASGRGFANLKSLSDLHVPALDGSIDSAAVGELVKTPLPCCSEHESQSSAGTSNTPSGNLPASKSNAALAKVVGELVKTPLPCCTDKQSPAPLQQQSQGEAP
ncbi:MAG: sulfite exporter TauE/SafE family protein, partial [Planctomycetales bacterium]|nr:sulfite exporter TauE/SafE family protein [Planctomycetales bacterium]